MDDPRFPAVPLQVFAQQILESSGVPPRHAVLVAQSLVAANLRAVDSHGVRLLTDYSLALKTGLIDGTAEGVIENLSGACATINGQRGLGQVISTKACDLAISLAQDHGVAFVSVFDSSHFGAASYWATHIARNGMLGLAFTNASPTVAPWQGRERRIGTNPICMALPGDDIWLLDMATTTVALNRIWKAASQGEPTLPAGWAMDAEGVPTTDTQAALAGFPMPLGGYKGSGLAVMVEILCSVLSGGAIGTEVGGTRVRTRPMLTSHAFIAIQVERFMPLAEFHQRMLRLRDMIKGVKPAPGYEEVLMAGEPEWRAEKERTASGIPISPAIWKELEDLARSLGVQPPVTIME
ncbi:MAG: Ldh family oxidoreductase [Acidobacteria bacterium]|nr:Ldh family oxidoreductase [Acidobacteriota bacterium]